MSNAEYIARKYLKKDTGKKRKKSKSSDFVEIQDEDVAGWRNEDELAGYSEEATLLQDQPTIVKDENIKDLDEIAIVQKAQEATVPTTSRWKPVGSTEGSQGREPVNESMENGPGYGLVTGKQVSEKARRQRERENQEMFAMTDEEVRKSKETVYRDATGRRIDITLARQEARKKLAEQELEKRRQKENQLGEVQVRQQEEYLEELERQKNVPLSRYEDDPEYNQELKERVRWNDPAAAFLTKRNTAATKAYQGYAPPNRFNIRPGHRWDGIIRSNGFENRWFQRQNERKAREHEAQMWAVEDM
ncbi:complexed with Cdc5 protein Cwf26 [Schizosaccharomyces cryophilus OY26]|uniref:Complexed with Cdc5 protein Cwf26 n=1 Tax=Schizosaccharomyces cryophilus (strain OY26 / ATCC MYA-4695 / CBS 11777 / NBRC 106824 / NRRL Y48691) TaxID=653667 RepID=S9XBT3_SCHCR|nr:complexed with Cdc5 protein Cwf26 [Schizosaccharomyces cryophilus OY26]EPY51286.1 complexed with Cdc5 protein Cwf26 [Schizosaccharomyces cryophilus OY26]